MVRLNPKRTTKLEHRLKMDRRNIRREKDRDFVLARYLEEEKKTVTLTKEGVLQDATTSTTTV